MKTSSDRQRRLDWGNIRLRTNGKTTVDVEQTSNISQLTHNDMVTLLSSIASGYLEQLTQQAQHLIHQ